MIKRWRTAVVLLLAPAALQGAEYSETVPLELLQPMLGNARILQGLPPGFPLPVLPPGLTVIGSVDHGPASQRVLLRSQQEGTAAARALRDSLLAAGWRSAPAVERGLGAPVPELGIRGIPPLSGGGFGVRDPFTPVPVDMTASAWFRDSGIVGVYPPAYHPGEELLCGEAGLLSLRGESGAGNHVYLQLQRLPEQIEQALCDAAPDPQPPASPPLDLLSHLPELRAGHSVPMLPEFSPRPGPAFSSGREYNTFWYSGLDNARALDIDVEYALQLLDQGWEQDAEWSTQDAAGSNWTWLSDAGLRLYLTLVVEELSPDVFLTQITLRTLP